MKNLFLTVVFSLPFYASFCQYSFTGVVRSKTNEPVPGASVQIKGTLIGVSTDTEGRFSLSAKSETLTLIIRHIAFEPAEAVVTAGQEAQIVLEPKAYLGDEVIVSATRARQGKAPASAQISAEEIEQRNLGVDLPYLLDQTPSVVVTSDAGTGIGYTYLRIRGSDQSRINVTINGIPYNDPESQQVYWVDLPDFASSVDNIEIQRGVGSSTHGAGAFGGTVNIQTTTLSREPYGELSGSYGSFRSWKATARFSTGLIKNHFTFDGRLSQIRSDGYIDRASADLKSFFASGGYYDNKTLLRVNVFSGMEKTYQSWWGVPEDSLHTHRTYNYYNYPDETDNYWQTHYQLLFSRQLTDNWTLNSALFYVRGKGYYEQYKGPEYNNDFGFNSSVRFSSIGLDDVIIGGDTIRRTSLIRRRWLDNHFYGLTFSALFNKKRTELILGGGANRYTGDHYGEIIWSQFASNGYKGYRYYDNTGEKYDLNLYGKLSYTLSPGLIAFIDLQYRFVSHDMAGINDDRRFIDIIKRHHFFNPKAGITFKAAPGHELFASYARGNREPTRSDYTDAPAGKQPVHESMHDLEIGYRFSMPRNVLSLNYYFMYYKNQLVLTGEVNDVGSPIKTNVPRSYRTGIELINRFSPADFLRWDASLTYSINRIKEFTEVVYVYDEDYTLLDAQETLFTNTEISYSPFLIGNSVVTVYPLRGLEIGWISKYVSRQYLDNTGSEDRMIKGYYVSNLLFAYTLKPAFIEHIRFTLHLNNIFNTAYESNGYVYSEIYEDDSGNRSRADYNYYFPQARFHVMGGITVRF
ncbi:MAG: TonB-dependent receptor [Chitinophagales bacterium]|nr:MAG: TonB-dependent receptor [Chitinophagales bacterium]